MDGDFSALSVEEAEELSDEQKAIAQAILDGNFDAISVKKKDKVLLLQSRLAHLTRVPEAESE